jgi:hypothetical protein
MIENNFDHNTQGESIMNEVTKSEVVENVSIKWNVKENPKRKGSQAHSRFAKYMKAKDVNEYLKLGGTRADLRYDEMKGFLTLSS